MKGLEGNQLAQLLLACNLVTNIDANTFKMDENEFNKRFKDFDLL